MRRLPLFTWINFVNAFIVIIALPVLNAGLAMILIDRQLEGHFFLLLAEVRPFYGNISFGRSAIRKFTFSRFRPSPSSPK